MKRILLQGLPTKASYNSCKLLIPGSLATTFNYFVTLPFQNLKPRSTRAWFTFNTTLGAERLAWHILQIVECSINHGLAQ